MILVEAYDKLGLNVLRDDAERVMKKNFPESPYLKGNAGKPSRSWWRPWTW
jgi:outer membrane protein assembly factor BamD